MSSSSHSWKFPSCFYMFPLCRWYRQQGLKAAYFPRATTLLLGYASKGRWMVTILPNCTTQSLRPLEPWRSYKHWVHLVLKRTAQNLFGRSEMLSFSQCRLQAPTTEVLKTIVLLYSSTVPGIWSGQKDLSVWSCVVQLSLKSRKIPDLLE